MKKIITKNRKAFHDYEIIEQLEVGASLLGSEIKSLRKGEADLKGSYAHVNSQGQLILKQMHIKEYQHASYLNHEPKRDRVLLAHKKEIHKLMGKMKKTRATSLIPLEVYFKGKWIKVLLALAVGKRRSDKRRAIKEKDQLREVERYEKRIFK